MRDATCAHDLAGCTVPSSCVWVTAADATWKNRPHGTSSSGCLVGRGRVVSVLTWKSRNICRVVRSSLGAGVRRGLDWASTYRSHFLLRVMWTLLCGDLVGLDQYEAFLQATDVVCINDCKGVADAKQRLAV